MTWLRLCKRAVQLHLAREVSTTKAVPGATVFVRVELVYVLGVELSANINTKIR